MHVRAARLPIFVGRAGLDAPPVNNSIDAFIAEALSANVPLDLMNHSTGQHAFDVLDDDERSRAIIRQALKFVTHLSVCDPGAYPSEFSPEPRPPR